MPPEVRYASNGDVRLAYQVIGSGPVDLMFVPGFVSHLDLAWEEPFLARFLRGMARFSRLIWFDKRGMGLSDPIVQEPDIKVRVDDIRAVLDAAGSQRAALFGVSEGGSLSVLFAAEHPDRVASLVLFAGYARGLRASGFEFAWSADFFESFLAGLEQAWARGSGVSQVNPSLAGDERYRAWFARYLRAGASPGMMRNLMRSNAAIDLCPLLSTITTRTLLLHRSDDPWMAVEHSRFLARHLPNATLAELSGVDHWPWIGDSDAVLTEIEAFLTRPSAQSPRPPRVGP